MSYFIRYCLFAIATVLALLAVLPFTILRPFNAKNNTVFFKVFKVLLEVFRMFKIHTEGEHNIEKSTPGILIGNHQHNFDVLTVSGLFKYQGAVLGKFELGLIPFFGQIFVLCGNVLIKRGNKKKSLESMQVLERKIKENKISILIFPEGTRNTGEKLKRFKKGAFHTAVKAQIPLIPFSISRYVVDDQLKTLKMVHIYVKVHSPIPTKGLTNSDMPELIKKSSALIESGIQEMSLKNKPKH